MRYLRQVGSGHIYVWTETLAKRKDMVEENLETVQRRIDALKEKMALKTALQESQVSGDLADLSKLKSASAELAALEGKVSEAELLEAKRNEVVSAIDPKLLKADDLVKAERQMTAEEIEDDRKSRILAGDKEYQSVLAMKTKDALLLYLKENFGVIPDEKMKMEPMRVLALTKRAERVFEVK